MTDGELNDRSLPRPWTRHSPPWSR